MLSLTLSIIVATVVVLPDIFSSSCKALPDVMQIAKEKYVILVILVHMLIILLIYF